MNNEPVAWRGKKFYETQEGWFYNENEIGEPLYTHPVKELTDEEILKHAEEFDIWLGKDDIEFIKFVLRKAGEK